MGAKKSNVVVYHADCSDGFGAAWAAYKKFGTSAEYVPMRHGDAPNLDDWRGRNVYVLDFWFPRKESEELARRAAEDGTEFLTLDHHITAAEELEGVPGVKIDLDYCGAVMAWLHFLETPIPKLLVYVWDRDLWRFNTRLSEEISYWIASHPMTFDAWDEMASRLDSEFEKVVTEARAIARHVRATVEGLVENHQTVVIAGYSVPAVNSPVYRSEIGHLLVKKTGALFAAVYYYDKSGNRVWSLRSDGFNVAALAKSLGGGGHVRAAGFKEVIT